MVIRRVQLWALALVALLNSGGMGYWVCHDQVRSGSFWLRACSEDVSFVLQVNNAPQPMTTPTLGVRACDCEFVALTAPLPACSGTAMNAYWCDALTLPAGHNLPQMAIALRLPLINAPPLRDLSCNNPLLRAPPTA